MLLYFSLSCIDHSRHGGDVGDRLEGGELAVIITVGLFGIVVAEATATAAAEAAASVAALAASAVGTAGVVAREVGINSFVASKEVAHSMGLLRQKNAVTGGALSLRDSRFSASRSNLQ